MGVFDTIEEANYYIETKEDDYKYLLFATKHGIVKKTKVKEYINIRKTGLVAINLREEDELIEVKATNGEKDILLVTKYGMCIRFNERDVRSTGRASMGVIGMNLDDGDEIVGMQLDHQGDSLLIVSENGLGNRTYLNEFKIQSRGGKGVFTYRITDKTGALVGMNAVDDSNDIITITDDGILIRMHSDEISTFGRQTQGVRIMRLADDVKVVSMALTSKEEDEPEQAEEKTE